MLVLYRKLPHTRCARVFQDEGELLQHALPGDTVHSIPEDALHNAATLLYELDIQLGQGQGVHI